MHALVAAVLLRMSRLDAFDRNAEAKPPDRELGEIEQAIGTGEGHAVVGADRERQASLTEQSFEGRAGALRPGRRGASTRSSTSGVAETLDAEGLVHKGGGP